MKTLKRMLSLGVILCIFVSLFSSVAYAKDTETIVILYENDVHCAVEGYSKLAAMKSELSDSYENVGVVSSGDFIQGGTLGAVSKGEYIIEIMNLVGYDAIALGNHEFDYTLTRLDELIDMMKTKPLSCNFYKIGEETPVYKPYSIVSYGDVDVAYIGITTPGTFTSTNPAQFRGDDGEYIYTFCNENLYEIVQKNVDAARTEGADVVIALSHVGYEDVGIFKDVSDVIENTDGIDVVLDAHTHDVIEGINIKNKLGEDVLLSSTGTEFEYIGKLTVAKDEITSELIKTKDYQKTDKAVDECLEKINEEYSVLGNRKIGVSKVELFTHSGENRLVRKAETNLGNLCADAYYCMSGADIAYVNGGSIRASIAAGDITFNDIYKMVPFNDRIVVAELKGSDIRDILELALVAYPEEDGSFPHVAGIRFSVDESLPTSVIMDEEGDFVSVDGEYRVYDIEVYNKLTKKYEPMNMDKTYTFAAIDYFLINLGGGMSMLKDVKILVNDGTLDVEMIEQYIAEAKGGVIGDEYEYTKQNITFTNGKVKDAITGFCDLQADEWYSEAAGYILENGIMAGVDEVTFAPDDNLTRAMLATMLYRAEGEPATNKSIPFSDVSPDSYYMNAVSWAKQNGIITGINENEFAPDDSITREQAVTILYRYARLRGYDVGRGESVQLADYDDCELVNQYAVSAVKYALGSGIINGRSENTINPRENVTRIETAVILYRFLTQNIK